MKPLKTTDKIMIVMFLLGALFYLWLFIINKYYYIEVCHKYYLYCYLL